MQTAKVMPVMEKDRAVVAKFKSHNTFKLNYPGLQLKKNKS